MEITKVGVLGAGTMGAGIAQICAQIGCDVALYDIDEEAVRSGVERIGKFLAKGVERKKVTPEERDLALAAIAPVTDLVSATEGAQLIIEAAPEDLELKRKILGDVLRSAPAHTVLATNTSSLPISRIAEGSGADGRIVGMHFFNPVPLMKLLEIVVGERTDPGTVATVRAFGERLGKEVIVVRDAPGFASSRLGIVVAMEAVRMIEQEVASPEDIDRAMVFGYGHPMGPLRLTDLVGCDVRMAIAEHLAVALDAPHFQPPELLRRMVAEGHLGKKSGRGFYDWTE